MFTALMLQLKRNGEQQPRNIQINQQGINLYQRTAETKNFSHVYWVYAAILHSKLV